MFLQCQIHQRYLSFDFTSKKDGSALTTYTFPVLVKNYGHLRFEDFLIVNHTPRCMQIISQGQLLNVIKPFKPSSDLYIQSLKPELMCTTFSESPLTQSYIKTFDRSIAEQINAMVDSSITNYAIPITFKVWQTTDKVGINYTVDAKRFNTFNQNEAVYAVIADNSIKRQTETVKPAKSVSEEEVFVDDDLM